MNLRRPYRIFDTPELRGEPHAVEVPVPQGEEKILLGIAIGMAIHLLRTKTYRPYDSSRFLAGRTE
jgi:hypothetical protein